MNGVSGYLEFVNERVETIFRILTGDEPTPVSGPTKGMAVDRPDSAEVPQHLRGAIVVEHVRECLDDLSCCRTSVVHALDIIDSVMELRHELSGNHKAACEPLLVEDVMARVRGATE